MLKAIVKLTESPRGQQAYKVNPGALEPRVPVESATQEKEVEKID